MQFSEIKEKIFLLTFDNHYDLAMHFVRFQEYYESPNPSFKKKTFTLIDFMEYYAKTYGKGVFSYTQDWGGFNISAQVLSEVFKVGIPDWNKYDFFMKRIFIEMKKKYPKMDFYLIGSITGNQSITNHELAHAFWTVNDEYKKEMTFLLKNTNPQMINVMSKFLLENMYDVNVLEDELQAYLCTGLTSGMEKILTENNIDIEAEAKPYQEVFARYSIS